MVFTFTVPPYFLQPRQLIRFSRRSILTGRSVESGEVDSGHRILSSTVSESDSIFVSHVFLNTSLLSSCLTSAPYGVAVMSRLQRCARLASRFAEWFSAHLSNFVFQWEYSIFSPLYFTC